VAFEDEKIALGFSFRREMGQNNTHNITAYFKNKTSQGFSGVSMQVAA